MVVPRFDNQSGYGQGSNGSPTTEEDAAVLNRNSEVSPDRGIHTGSEMSIDSRAPDVGTGTMVAVAPPSSEATVNDGIDNRNYDADGSDNSDNTDDEEEDDYSDSEDSSDSSDHTPTSVISYSLISFYRTIDGVGSDSDADSNADSLEIFVVAECRICRSNYVVPRGTIVYTRCGYAGLVHFGDD